MCDTSNARLEKNDLRKKMKALRAGLSPEDREKYSAMACEQLQNLSILLDFPGVLLGYLALPQEVVIDRVLYEWLARGRQVGVPVVSGSDIMPYSLPEPEKLEISTFGIREPQRSSTEPLCPDRIKVVVLPGLAFDQQGYRLGYGKGYYDRFFHSLKHRPLLVGVAFDFQLLDHIPKQEHDVPLDLLVTPSGVTFFTQGLPV